jgi:hypothetical protein
MALVAGDGVAIRLADLFDPVLLCRLVAVAGAVVGRNDTVDGVLQGDPNEDARVPLY